MKLLVTGGAGFIGSHLLQLAAAAGKYETVVLDNLSHGKKNNVPEGVRLVQGDVRDRSLKDFFLRERFDAVIHLAAQTMVPYSLQHPDEDCDINLMGIINVLECCRCSGVRNISFSSSAAVYGDNANIPLHEDEVLRPLSFYGLTKMTCEHYLRLYHDLYGLNASVLRFANVYGERQGECGEGGVISIFCRRIAAGEGVTIFGSGRQTRDFVYAGDVAEALLKSAELEGYNVMNISTGRETSLNGLTEAFRKAAGRSFPVEYEPEREGDICRSVLDNGAARRLLGTCPAMGLEEGVLRTYREYLKTMNGV